MAYKGFEKEGFEIVAGFDVEVGRLQTGAGWAGPIGQAELFVNLPYPASEETR